MVDASDAPNPDALVEGLRLIEAGRLRSIPLRLLGGVAVRACVPEIRAEFRPPGQDIDLVSTGKYRAAIQTLLPACGYVPDRGYNGIHGHKQLYFLDAGTGRPVDVILDELDMCHRLPLASRLPVTSPTIPLADLLLSKLQVVKVNRKDLVDGLVLLGELPITDDDTGISRRRITAVTGDDWGWWRTVTGNLANLRQIARDEAGDGTVVVGRPFTYDPAIQVDLLLDAIEAHPKSLRWRARSKVGDRVPWYEEPEEVGHG